MKNIRITFELRDVEAEALAQLVKRIGWTELRRCAVDDDETRVMIRSISILQEALAQAGYRPR